MPKKIFFNITVQIDNDLKTQEAFDFILAAKACDFDVIIIFKNSPDFLKHEKYIKKINALKLYDITDIYFEGDDAIKDKMLDINYVIEL